MPKHALIMPNHGTLWSIDPIDAFRCYSAQDISESLGLIPGFISVHDDRCAKEQFESNYGFGPLFDLGGSVDERGVYHSQYEEPSDVEPGDPPLPPLAHLRFRNEDIWLYQYAIVAIKNDAGNTFITRMD